MTEATHRIRKLRLREISFVPEGDNPGAEVMICKARDRGEIETEVVKARFIELCEAANDLQELAAGEGGDEGIQKAAQVLGGLEMDIEELQARLEEIEASVETITKDRDDQKARADKAEADLKTANEAVEKAKAEAAKDEPKDDEDEILKSVPKPIRDRLEKAEKQASDAMGEVEKARDQRDLDVAIEKVKGLGVKDADSLGAVLHRIAKGKSTPEDAAKIEELITVAKNVGDKGNQLFEAIGKAKGEDAAATKAEEAEGKLEAAITDLRKAKPSLTREQAYSEVLDAQPELYEQINKRHPDLDAVE